MTSDYDGNLELFYERLREDTPIGYAPIRNNMDEYLARNDVSPYFNLQQPIDGQHYNYQLIANSNAYDNIDIV